jgi:N-acetylglucosamine-6-sulfatase
MNILFYITDDQNMDCFSKMAALPRGNWRYFDNAFISTPVCACSRCVFLKGQYSWQANVNTNEQCNNLDDSDTIATRLQSAGYTTGLLGKYLNDPYDKGNGITYIPQGWNEWKALVIGQSYYNYDLNENGTIVPYGTAETDYQPDVATTHAVEFIQNVQGPFFCVVAGVSPHDVPTPPERYKTLVVPEPVLPPNFNEADVSDKPSWIQSKPILSQSATNSLIAKIKKTYRCAKGIDDNMVALMDALDTAGKLDDTIVIFASDNGFSYGPHRWVGKQVIYEESIHTPLAIRVPGQTEQHDQNFASNIDWYATIADAAGLSIPSDGISLLNGADPQRDALLFGWRAGQTNFKYYAVRTATHKYTEYGDGFKELIDLIADPYELQNKAGVAGYETIQADMKARLDALKAGA